MKFSILVPVYNVELYIEKCLESINNQTYKNFEVIIVDDGSPDNSAKIIKKYIKGKDNFKYYKKENGGLSDARNYGLKYVTGDYLLFVDSDDYIEDKLLEEINNVLINKKYDIVKFNINDIINGKVMPHIEKNELNGIISINDLICFDYFEPACGYCYNFDFFAANCFKFEVGKYHEDFGLIPLILLEAESIYYINYFGYNYVKRDSSITSDKTKNEKKANDTLYFALNNIDIISSNNSIDKITKDYILNFYANGAIRKLNTLQEKKNYRKKLKKNNMYKYLLNNTIKQKIKKLICFISYDLFIKLF